ncbi:hypothetical protein Mapa_008728 [Marchantia paleacea]|nr:hypothetical protein Mapa_008728 [Marchantia paleacea]
MSNGQLEAFGPGLQQEPRSLCVLVIPLEMLFCSGIRTPDIRHCLEIPNLQMYYHLNVNGLGPSRNVSIHPAVCMSIFVFQCHRQRTRTCS